MASEIRYAGPEDAVAIWSLANHPSVRSNAFNQEAIAWDDHLAWFTRKLNSPDTKIWVIEVDKTFAGQLRYDRLNAELAEVDFAIVDGFRGRGLAAELLTQTFGWASDALGVECVEAAVLIGNHASSRTLLKAGFRFDRNEVRYGRACWVYVRSS